LPDHPCPQSLISACGSPIIGTSANKHGAADPTTAEEVQRQLGNRLSVILDGGPTPVDRGSTMLDVTQSPARLLRAGPISLEELRLVCAVADPDEAPRGAEARS
jgi:L-threonylcarbamoyladenylate synthase